MSRFSLAIHGGAGTLIKGLMTSEMEANYKKALDLALEAGYEVLKKGGSSLDAVEVSVKLLEDTPLFNAGKGSVFTAKGTHEMDAAIMDGKELDAGAVSLITGIRNPVALARDVMEKSDHVFLAGEGGDEFAESKNLEIEPPEYFRTERRIKQLEDRKSKKERGGSLTGTEGKFGTVGAVALDQNGNLSAATSTRGTSNKLKGRIGDTPIIGSGTYANNNSCGISCTGDGEYFIRNQAAFSVSALVEIGKISMKDAMKKVIDEDIGNMGGVGGMIGLDRDGNYYWYFNSKGMYRGVLFDDGVMLVEIFGSP